MRALMRALLGSRLELTNFQHNNRFNRRFFPLVHVTTERSIRVVKPIVSENSEFVYLELEA